MKPADLMSQVTEFESVFLKEEAVDESFAVPSTSTAPSQKSHSKHHHHHHRHHHHHHKTGDPSKVDFLYTLPSRLIFTIQR